jgi:hypothetical protein
MQAHLDKIVGEGLTYDDQEKLIFKRSLQETLRSMFLLYLLLWIL